MKALSWTCEVVKRHIHSSNVNLHSCYSNITAVFDHSSGYMVSWGDWMRGHYSTATCTDLHSVIGRVLSLYWTCHTACSCSTLHELQYYIINLYCRLLLSVTITLFTLRWNTTFFSDRIIIYSWWLLIVYWNWINTIGSTGTCSTWHTRE